MTAIISARQLTKSYTIAGAHVDVLRGVDLELSAGESVAIVGPSGSGKSTLLHILGTLDSPTSGTLTIAGTDVATLAGAALASFRNRTVGFIFQDHHLLPQLSAAENVLIPALPGAGVDDGTYARAVELLKGVGLAERLDSRPSELSGGERQRVAVARALINRPAVLLCDEPTGNLDRRTATAVTETLLEMQRSTNAVLVYVTHSEELADRMGRRMRLDDGLLVAA